MSFKFSQRSCIYNISCYECDDWYLICICMNLMMIICIVHPVEQRKKSKMWSKNDEKIWKQLLFGWIRGMPSFASSTYVFNVSLLCYIQMFISITFIHENLYTLFNILYALIKILTSVSDLHNVIELNLI